MGILITIGLLIQALLILQLVMPVFLFVFRQLRKKSVPLCESQSSVADYAAIVTAYGQTEQLTAVVDSLLGTDYDNYLIYVVADNCDVKSLDFPSDRVIVCRPPEILANNVKSHFYAIDHFRRNHERLTIIDSDNLVDPNYFNALNEMFDKGYEAVQGVRRAKNLNTPYACLDEAGDIFYRMIDRKLLYEAGSSAALSGSGMAFTTALYKQCFQNVKLEGAGFDKVLQYELLMRGKIIAFAENVVVLDEKTAGTDQLVKQRSRWINTWFKYFMLGWRLLVFSIKTLSINRFLFSLMLLRPPLFILLGLAVFCLTLNVFFKGEIAIAFGGALLCFVGTVAYSLHYFNADRRIYRSLISAPKFIGYQLLALVKAKKANKLSVATEHYFDKDNQH